MKIKEIINGESEKKILATKDLPGERWKRILSDENWGVHIGSDNEGESWGREDLRRFIQQDDYLGVISQLTDVWDAELMEEAFERGVKFISNYAVGYNNIDMKKAEELGVLVGNTPGVLSDATAECAVALTCAAMRRLTEMDRFVRRGLFKGIYPTLGLGKLIEGSIVGVVGLGGIGRTYAMKMAGLGAHIYYHTRSGRNDEFEESFSYLNKFRESLGKKKLECRMFSRMDEMTPKCDVISLHVPLTAETERFMNARRLGLMKKGAVLINTARGKVVDEKALVRMLKNKEIFAAGLDVYENEPVLSEGLKDLENCVLSPHVGSATSWTRETMAVMAAINMRGMIKGFQETKDFQESLERLVNGETIDSILSLVHSE